MKKSAFHKFIIAICVAICIPLAASACAGSVSSKDKDTVATGSESTEAMTSSTPAPDATVTYQITVVDANGSPLSGAYVQLCFGNQCLLPVATNADGIAIIETAEADYTVKIILEGYTGEAEYHFAEGATELKVQLTKIQADSEATEP
ncbi:MAG: hypothetical protein IJY39_03550 [Clostridia bacterium]|nr:hypothetical protein [Clostridia bacterium]